MTRIEVEKGAALVARILAALLTAAGADRAGRAGADLRLAAGDLQADAGGLIRSGGLFAPLAACFALARTSGASFEALERVRAAISAEPSPSALVSLIRTRALGLCLAQQAQVLADTTFVSREDVDRVSTAINAAFDASEEAAADAGDQEAYRALISLHAAVTRDLTTRARPLPRLVTYSLPQSLPALALASRLYGDAGRYDDLIAENKTPHPLFCSATGRALSA